MKNLGASLYSIGYAATHWALYQSNSLYLLENYPPPCEEYDTYAQWFDEVDVNKPGNSRVWMKYVQ